MPSTEGYSECAWTKVRKSEGGFPRPRHGHRACTVNNGKDILILGGGNEGIIDGINLYDTVKRSWKIPTEKGQVPNGIAAFGMVNDGNRVIVFGGMQEYGRYSNEMYELNVSNWEWKKLSPGPPENGEYPKPRLGHSFNLIGNRIFMFGGLANSSPDERYNYPEYLNDLYSIELRNIHGVHNWMIPNTYGTVPSPRESHTAVSYRTKDGHYNILIYGGMNGSRLSDVHILDIDSCTWSSPKISGVSPLPRSLHTSTLVDDKLYVFGGWVPLDAPVLSQEREWKCTDQLSILNVSKLTWETVDFRTDASASEDGSPRARAGHAATMASKRLYIWSGRDGYRKAWNNQVCCKDMWFLELFKPSMPNKPSLSKATCERLDVSWNTVNNASFYQIQLQLLDQPKDQNKQNEESKKPAIVPPKPPLPALPKAPIAPLPPMKVEPAVDKGDGEVSSKVKEAENSLPAIDSNNSNVSAMALLAAAAAARIPENKKENSSTTPTATNTATNTSTTVASSQSEQSTKSQSVTILTPHGKGGQQITNILGDGNKPIQILGGTGQHNLKIVPSAGSNMIKTIPIVGNPSKVLTINSKGLVESAAINTTAQKKTDTPSECLDKEKTIKNEPNQTSSDSKSDSSLQAEIKKENDAPEKEEANKATENTKSPEKNKEKETEKMDVDVSKGSNIKPEDKDVSAAPKQESKAEVKKPAEASKPNGISAIEKRRFSFDKPKPLNRYDPTPRKGQWYDVCTAIEKCCKITKFAVRIPEGSDVDPKYKVVDIEGLKGKFVENKIDAGVSYRVRLRACNKVGCSDWSDCSIFKTAIPGFPGAPSAVKISKNAEGVAISWCPPSTPGKIEYAVYLAVNPTANPPPSSKAANYTFVRVYYGTDSSCQIGNKQVENALIDTSSKPAVIFRIAAKNTKGFGPATQVRWLQVDHNKKASKRPAITTTNSQSKRAKV